MDGPVLYRVMVKPSMGDEVVFRATEYAVVSVEKS